ncbi:hypothetical protein BV20DRAFT_125148 [Pilatotrama ljubarskyi]|nr:hypothetical protein BV20DRAFT_125148 [Pilatotrama ljubarskyi]
MSDRLLMVSPAAACHRRIRAPVGAGRNPACRKRQCQTIRRTALCDCHGSSSRGEQAGTACFAVTCFRGCRKAGFSDGLGHSNPHTHNPEVMNATAMGTCPALGEEQSQHVSEALTHSRYANYVNLAAFVVVCFDHLLTMDCEVRLVWGRKISFAKLILLSSRYLSLLRFFFALAPSLPPGLLLFAGTGDVLLPANSTLVTVKSSTTDCSQSQLSCLSSGLRSPASAYMLSATRISLSR